MPKKLTPEINKLIKDKYYKKPKRPVVATKDLNEISKLRLVQYGNAVHKLKTLNSLRRLDDFPVAPIPTFAHHKGQTAFTKITYPLKTIIPNPAEFGGVEELVFKTYKGKPNCIRYYTKNKKKLTQEQCDIIYRDEERRVVFGYTINDSSMSTEMLLDYLAKTEKYDKIKDAIEEQKQFTNTKAIQEYGRKIRRQRAINEIAPTVQVNPDGSRRPVVIQMGMNSYMDRNKLKNPTEIITTHATGEKLKIYDIINLGGVLNEVNITPQEAFDYLCSYLNKSKKILKIHTENRETARGSTALKNLIDYYNDENKRTTDDRRKGLKVKIFGYPQLMKSEQYKDYCKITGEQEIKGYESFRKWAKDKIDFVNNINNKKK